MCRQQNLTGATIASCSPAPPSPRDRLRVERVEVGSMLPTLLRVTDQDQAALLGLADGHAPAEAAMLSELGLVEDKRATRLGMALGAALRLVEQIAPGYEAVRRR